MIKKVTLDTLDLHDLTTTCDYIVRDPIKGLDLPSIRTTQYNRSGTDGIRLGNIYTGERRITIVGSVRSIPGATFETARKNLVSACQPQRTNDYPITKTLYLTTSTDETYQVNVQVLSCNIDIRQVNIGDFIIDMIATDDIVSQTLTSVNVSLKTYGGFILPVVVPIVFDSGTGGIATITNSGDIEAYPLIRLNGDLTNPRITNETTGQSIALTHTLTSGAYIEIDVKNRTILQGGVTNQLSKLTDDSVWWKLAVGVNRISLSSSDSGNVGNAVVSYRDTYAGI